MKNRTVVRFQHEGKDHYVYRNAMGHLIVDDYGIKSYRKDMQEAEERAILKG